MKQTLYLLVWLLCTNVFPCHRLTAQPLSGEMEFMTAKQAAQHSLDLARTRFDAGAYLVQVEFEQKQFGGYEIICNHLTGTATGWTSLFYMPSLDSVYSITPRIMEQGILQFGIEKFPGDTLAGELKIPVVDNWQDSDYLFQQFRNAAMVSDWLRDYPSPTVFVARIQGSRYEISLRHSVLSGPGAYEICRCEGDAATGISDDCAVTTGIPQVAETASFAIASISPQPANAGTNELSVSISSPEHTGLEASITDVAGKNIATVYKGSLNRGDNTIRIPLGAVLRSGTYFLVFRARNESVYKPVLIIR